MAGPNFLVAGAARAGTTALIEGLRLHPDVFVTQPKEPHYFAYHDLPLTFTGPGDDQWVNKVAITDRARYLALFDPAEGKAARGDGSVTSLYCAERAAPEILDVNPDMRIVIVLREPVERAYSSFTYLRLRGVEPEADFRRALELEDQRRAANWHHMWHYRAMSQYASGLQTLYKMFGSKQIGVWFYDDLQSDYERVLSEVVRFIGLEPFAAGPPSLPRVNASGTARSEVAQRALRWATRHQRVRGGLKRVIGFQARERIRATIVRSESLSSDAYAELAPIFADDLAEVASLVPGDQPDWLRQDAQF